jgi:secreted trypsin-like serine protease
MKSRKIVTAAVAAVLTASGFAAMNVTGSANAVVSGTVARQPYPWLVNLTVPGGSNDDLHVCGASMITDRWAVTAAHCVDGGPVDELVARVGSNDRTSGGHVRQLARVIKHPNFNRNPGDRGAADIALIELSARVDVRPVRIASVAATTPGTRTRILGWGNICAGLEPVCDENPVLLHQLDTQITAGGDCASIDPVTELCTGDPAGGSGACHGDSGGPQVIATSYGQLEIVGVTSRLGHGETTCARGPSIYTSVPSYARWITDTLARNARQ